MGLRNLTGTTSMSVVLAGMLCLGMLSGCAGKANPGQQVTDEPAAEAPATSAEATDGVQADSAAQDDVSDSSAAAAGAVEIGSFTFDIPAYWADKVECHAFTDDEGYEKAVIYLPGDTNAELAELSLVPGEQPESAGDIGRHLVGSIADGNGNHVEVWTYNWPWLAANSAATNVTEDQLAQLVDLSTGGVLSLDGLASEDETTVNAAEYGFMAAELVPTIAFG